MKRPLLILDATYLCWRAQYTTGHLSYKGEPTGVIYGFLRDVVKLQDIHATNRIAFCFDYDRKSLLRKRIYPGYKSSRDSKVFTETEAQNYKNVQQQIIELREFVLGNLGFNNVFTEKGYEADDLIAAIVQQRQRKEEMIIVGGDHDLYQLLSPLVSIWNPSAGLMTTEDSFSKTYGITPTQWIDVKAIAGCSSDDVKGVKGIGELTAAKFLSGKLLAGSAKHTLIISNNKTWRHNIPIVKLPYVGTPVPELMKDDVSDLKWRRMLQRFGIRSINELYQTLGVRNDQEETKKRKAKESRQRTKV